jgi:hypothetical protein
MGGTIRIERGENETRVVISVAAEPIADVVEESPSFD